MVNNVSAADSPYALLTDRDFDNRQSELAEFWQGADAGTFTGVDNTEIAYRTLIQAQDREKAVVIASGRTETFDQYRETAYNLYRQGYSVFIHDHRGQGYSARLTADKEKGYVERFEDYTEDLKTFYDQYVAPEGFTYRFLLAHSMGGAIASLYLQDYPTDFHAGALSSPMLEIDTGALGSTACLIAKTAESISQLIGKEPAYLVTQKPYEATPFKPDIHTALTHSASRYNDKLRLMEEYPELRLGGITNRWFIEACRAKDKIIANVEKIEVPVLVIQAGIDKVVTAKGQNRFCQALGDAGNTHCHGKKPLVIEGGFHELLQETDRYRIPTMTAILDFFEKLVASEH